MALFKKFDYPPATLATPATLPQQNGQTVATVATVIGGKDKINVDQPKPATLICYLCRGYDFWLGGTEKYPKWICRKCHPAAPGAERFG